MAKYSAEFKCKVVQEYLNGHIGYTALTKKYDTPSSKCIQAWGGKYRRMWKDGPQPFMIEVTRRFAIDKSDIRPQSISKQIMDYG